MLVVLAVLLQLGGGSVWVPLARRWLGGSRTGPRSARPARAARR
jgi:hypothetical protein